MKCNIPNDTDDNRFFPLLSLPSSVIALLRVNKIVVVTLVF